MTPHSNSRFLHSQCTSLTSNKKVQLIDTLRGITEGKIFVELERARLTKLLASIYESNGDAPTASKLMQDIQVETFGAMDRKEKTAFILEQVRLCLDTKDFVRALILSNKVVVVFVHIKLVSD